jgi:hypothetical protein
MGDISIAVPMLVQQPETRGCATVGPSSRTNARGKPQRLIRHH